MLATLICGTLTIAVVVASFFAGRRSMRAQVGRAYLAGLRDGVGSDGSMRALFPPSPTVKDADKITAKDLGFGLN